MIAGSRHPLSEVFHHSRASNAQGNGIQRGLDAIISALVDQIEDKTAKKKIARNLVGAIPTKFMIGLLKEIEEDLAKRPDPPKKEPASHTHHLKMLQDAVDKLQLENKLRRTAQSDLEAQSKFRAKQFSEFLRDKANIEVDMEEKQRTIQKQNQKQITDKLESELNELSA